MTSQKLYEILTYLDSLDSKLNLQSILESVRTALNNITSAPAQPQHQNSLASGLGELDKAAAQLKESITPSQRSIIEAMGGQQFFDPSMAVMIRAYVEKNAMTPSVARDFVQAFVDQRTNFMANVRGARQNLEKLKITSEPVAEGSADLAFLIPRNIFDNELGQFAKELSFLNRLLGHYNEALTPDAEPIQLEELSSSIPTVALAASVPVIGAIAFAVNKFLEAWEKIEKIRKIRAELSEMAIKGSALEELEERITTTVDEVVEESTQHVLINYKGAAGRGNELRNAISQDTRRLFGQIERGLAVEFRATPQPKGDPETQRALTDIANVAHKIEFPDVVQEPMLLKSGEIVEGELRAFKQTKRTTTQKTTVTKKAAQKEEVEAGD